MPSRNEPDTDGEINYPYIFHQIAKLGYKGWIGCEYHPRGKRLLSIFPAPFKDLVKSDLQQMHTAATFKLPFKNQFCKHIYPRMLMAVFYL